VKNPPEVNYLLPVESKFALVQSLEQAYEVEAHETHYV